MLPTSKTRTSQSGVLLTVGSSLTGGRWRALSTRRVGAATPSIGQEAARGCSQPKGAPVRVIYQPRMGAIMVLFSRHVQMIDLGVRWPLS